MKKRRILIVISACLLLPVMLTIATTLWMTEGGTPSDDVIISLSDKLIDDSMIILKKYPEGVIILHEKEYPESVKALSPLSLWSDSEGLYILTKKEFIQGRGIFIPREDSEKYLEKNNHAKLQYDRKRYIQILWRLVSRSGMVETPRLQAKKVYGSRLQLVIPAKAGIQKRPQIISGCRIESGMTSEVVHHKIKLISINNFEPFVLKTRVV